MVVGVVSRGLDVDEFLENALSGSEKALNEHKLMMPQAKEIL